MSSEFIVSFISLFIGMNLISILPIYLRSVEGKSSKQKALIISIACIIVLFMAMSFSLLGRAILNLTGITVPYSLILSGIALVALAIILSTKTYPRTTITTIPLLAGLSLLTISLMAATLYGYHVLFVSLILNLIIAWIILSYPNLLLRIFTAERMKTISKVVCLLLLLLGIIMIREGVRGAIATHRITRVECFEILKTFPPESCHEYLLKTIPQCLGYDSKKNFRKWRQEVAEKLKELIGVLPEKVPLNLRIEQEWENDLFKEKRFVFSSEAHTDVPCHLLIPKKGKAPFPVVICLQGHTPGMHLSLGRAKYDGDKELITGEDTSYAIQAIHEGYAALVIEQRCFGERKTVRFGSFCQHPSMTALLLGRTMIGERVWDVSRAIDALDEFHEIDTNKIGCMGHSAGGTVAYFSACLDKRIKIAMVSGYICTFRDSIGMIFHCECNYIPGILKYFEMGDLACLIAPRALVVVTSRNDKIFPIKGAKETFSTIHQIYDKAGVPNKCKLVIGKKKHRFYSNLAWPVFRKLSGW
jgi:small neutral amino acid transporter SnatA (MarC family)/cephalosporin-C deacetylase-like acetyl esterase